MVPKASNAIGRQRDGGVIGGSRNLDGSGRDAVQRRGGLNGGVEAGDLTGLPLGFGRSGGGLRDGCGRGGLGAVKTSAAEVEGIPAKAEAAEHEGDDRQDRDADGQPAQRLKRPQDRRRHGNTFRSSSKCGPSRKRGQSPPQTMATPLALAAALIASAIRG